jgi:DMSO/TMAO reductase YedYZ molybdopterin-dependent catalytic subunit
VRGDHYGLLKKEAILMEESDVSRRALLKGGGAMLAGLSVLQVSGSAQALSRHLAGGSGLVVGDSPLGPSAIGPQGTVIAWDDQPADIPPPAQNIVGNRLHWESLNSFFIPSDSFFTVKHYEIPPLTATGYSLKVDGLVRHPKNLSLADLKRRARHAVDFTLECSGNNGLPFAIGIIGTARWAGASLASLLREAGVEKEGTEVVFWGADSGTVTIRDNGGILSGGHTGTLDNGALTITEHFARAMSVEDALDPEILLCYEMNGGPLPPEHGFPVRLIAPGWYGVANVKWLTHIEVRDQRYTGRFMARDYVSIREQTDPNGGTLWTFSNVGHARLKSAPAKVVKQGSVYSIVGVAWGAPIKAVQVRIDNGPWLNAQLIGPRPPDQRQGFTWRFWSFPWETPSAGQHTVTSRAIDVDGNVQPAPDDAFLASKVTYWESNGQITHQVTIP